MKNILLHLLSIGFFSIMMSCSPYYVLPKGEIVYKYEEPAPGTFQITAYQCDSNMPAKIRLQGSYYTINADTNHLKPLGTLFLSKPITSKYMEKGYYIPEPFFDAVQDLDTIPERDRNFTFREKRLSLQPFTIPLKIRGALNDPGLLDSFPSTSETSINLNLAIGYKFIYNHYQKNKTYQDQDFFKFSWTPGVFLGVGGADLNKSTTRNPAIEFNRKAPVISFGCFAMLGFNNLNIGLSFGADHAAGIGSTQWLYQNKWWLGIGLGFDIVK